MRRVQRLNNLERVVDLRMTRTDVATPCLEGDCDCEGNQLDECGVCGGVGAVFECGCADIPVGDCDCNGNQLDALGVCGGDAAALRLRT